MNVLLLFAIAVSLIQCGSDGKRQYSFPLVRNRRQETSPDDVVLTIEPLPPKETFTSKCSCKCCDENTPAGATGNTAKCLNDIVVAVDSSACFRDYHSKTIRFLKKFVKRLNRETFTQFGLRGTRLSLIQFSSDIEYRVNLSSFENFTRPASSKALMNNIVEEIKQLPFLGEGAFLDKALNATASQIRNNPRPLIISKNPHLIPPRKVVIVLTNGNSHPDVQPQDIDDAIMDLKSVKATVFPISVTRRCLSPSNTWGDGLCPNPQVLDKLAAINNKGVDELDLPTFMEMDSSDTIPDVINYLKCFNNSGQRNDSCRKCNCSCEFENLPVGPRGLKGEKGESGTGIKGEKGIRGYKGEDGNPGSKGDKGDSGDFGAKGERGDKGDKGVNGSVGDKGERGHKGNEGLKGSKGGVGEPGPKGEPGKFGDKGETGDKGVKGSEGTKGSKGGRGIKGEPGSNGTKGEKGLGKKGERGPPGPRGAKGRIGFKGEPGFSGRKGQGGKCGRPGPAGKPGEMGFPGTDGIEGPEGPPGIQGIRGEPGATGDKGEPGEIGAHGNKGEPGLRGGRGMPGLEGVRGQKGAKGEPSRVPGNPGRSGIAGPKGEPGEPGVRGLDGEQGRRGIQGPRGYPGEPGPPGTIELERLRPYIVQIILELMPGDDENTTLKPTEEIRCYGAITDIVFVLDHSATINKKAFSYQKEFISQISRQFQYFGANGLRIAVVTYSEKPTLQLGFNETVTKTKLLLNVGRLKLGRLPRGNSKTGKAIQFAAKLLDNISFSRKLKTTRVIVVVTDGRSKDDVRTPSKTAQQKQIILFSVGVDQAEDVVLNLIASYPQRNHVYKISQYDQLSQLSDAIAEHICHESRGIYIHRDPHSTDQGAPSEPTPTPFSTPTEDTTEEVFVPSGDDELSF